MAPVTNNEITSAWRALSKGNEKSGWLSIAISGLDGARLMAGRCFPGNCEALLVKFTAIKIPPQNQLPQGSGFRVERVELGTPGVWLALIRQAEGSLDLFTLMVSDVVSMLVSNAKQEEAKLFQLFLGRIRSWQQFMKKGSEGLSTEEELGLVGELECLDALLSSGVPAYLVLEGWRGPLDGIRDYELGHGAIEVKSTLATEGFKINIVSLEQLDDTSHHPLFVCACRLAQEESGLTLPGKIKALQEKLNFDASAEALFENAMLHAGYRATQADFYTRKFKLSEMRFHLVNDSFPRLTSSNVPLGIRAVKYEVELAAGSGTTHSLIEVLGMIGM
jgi:hypothetical protein